MLTVRELYDRTVPSWGGATIDRLTSTPVPDGIDAYAVTVKPDDTASVAIPETATYAQFVSAYDQARSTFWYAPYLGVFHNDSKSVIQFDPVVLAWSEQQVDAIYSTYPTDNGGAYHFATGLGYWPEGVNH